MPERRTRVIQVSDTLRAGILAGSIQNELPSMEVLGRQHNVSRLTMRNALKLLESEGLVSIEQGRGTFVRRGEVQIADATLSRPYRAAFERYYQFLTNPGIAEGIKSRVIDIMEAQMVLVETIQTQKIEK